MKYIVILVMLLITWPLAANPLPICPVGGLNPPLEILGECKEGRQSQPSLCCQVEQVILDTNKFIDCADPDDCVEITSQYFTCGGPIGAFAIDDDDNTYFWGGSWQFHSLDKEGKFRWSYRLCDPIYSPLCRVRDGVKSCSKLGSMPPVFIDYWGDIFFIIGDLLHVLSPDGTLKLRKRINIPGLTDTLPNGSRVIISNGVGHLGINIRSVGNSYPVLLKDGSIIASYLVVLEGGNERYDLSGWIKISREGEVLKVYDIHQPEQPNEVYKGTRLIGNGDAHIISANSSSSKTQKIRGGQFTTTSLKNGEVKRTPIPDEFVPEYDRPHDCNTCSSSPDYIISPMAVDPQGRVWGMGSAGRIFAYDPPTQTLRIVLDMGYSTWGVFSNSPVIDERGILYIARDAKGPSSPTIWALDTAKMWHKTDTTRYQSLEQYRAIDGVKFIYASPMNVATWSTPVVADNGRLYVGAGGLVALDRDTGELIWRVGKSSLGSFATVLSNGHIVFRQTTSSHVYMVKESNSTATGPVEGGWPVAFHDRYHSNNAAHPFRWDRTKPAPYDRVKKHIEPIDESVYIPTPQSDMSMMEPSMEPVMESVVDMSVEVRDAEPDLKDQAGASDMRMPTAQPKPGTSTSNTSCQSVPCAPVSRVSWFGMVLALGGLFIRRRRRRA